MKQGDRIATTLFVVFLITAIITNYLLPAAPTQKVYVMPDSTARQISEMYRNYKGIRENYYLILKQTIKESQTGEEK